MSGKLYSKITEIYGASTARECTATILCLAVKLIIPRAVSYSYGSLVNCKLWFYQGPYRTATVLCLAVNPGSTKGRIIISTVLCLTVNLGSTTDPIV